MLLFKINPEIMKNLHKFIAATFLVFTFFKVTAQTFTLNPYMPGTTCPTCVVTSNTNPKGGNNTTMNGNGTIATSYVASGCGLNYVMGKVKLGKRLPAPGVNQPAAISIAGLPPCFVGLKAFLYCGGSGNGIAINATVQNPALATAAFPMTMIGQHVDKCWGYTGTYNYRADITAMITGNGNYIVSGIPTSPPTAGNDMDGATIVIIYQDLTQAYTGHIVIGDGCLVGVGGQVNNNLTGWSACAASTFANAFMIVSDLQNVGVANCFMNSAANNFNYAMASQDWWDNIIMPAAPAVTAGQNTTAFGLGSGGDCFNIVAEGLYYRTACQVCPAPATGLTVTAASTPSCPTSNATVTALGGTAPYTYTWTPSAQSTSIATGLAAGVYTVFVKDATGCKTGSTTVTVITSPLVPISINNGTICPTFSVNLTASGASSYTWSPPTGLNTTNGPNVVASPPATQIYSVAFTNSLGCKGTQTTQVIVNPTPTLTTNNVTVCAGSAINLTANSLAGSTYSWSGPSGFTSNVQNPVIAISTTLMTGPYTVTVTSSVGCKNTAIANVTVFAVPVPVIGSNAPICANNNLNLTGSGGATYTWVGPNGFSSVLQNPTIVGASTLATGVYTLTASANGCSASTSSLLTINPLPTPTLTSNTPVCNGFALNLFASGGNTYSWTGPSAFTSTLQNPVINPAAPINSGIYTLTAISVNGCTATTTSSITINPTPTISITGATVCLNTTINLLSNSLAGSTYSWSGPLGFNSTLQNPSITNATLLMSGVYNLTVTSSVGCKNTASVNVSVLTLPTPTITSNSPFCFGSVLTLTAGGGVTYQWNGPNGFSSTLTNPTINNITLAGSGTYSLMAFVGTCSASITQSITVNPLPVPTATNNGPICNGQTLNLSSAGAVTYTWSGPSTFSSTSQNPSIAVAAPVNSGIYTVTVTDLNGCKNFTTTNVTVNPTPTLSATGTTVCLNTTINLFGNALAGSTYSWTGPLAFNSTVQNPTITNATLLMSGVYNLTVTSPLGCVNTTTTNVSVLSLPVPSITSNAPVCLGSILTLTASGGVTYQWNGPNGFSSVLSNPTINNINLAGSGNYSLIAIVGTCTASTTQSITVNPLPVPTATNNGPICNGQTLNLSSAGAVTYTWSGPSAFSSTSQNSSIAVAAPVNSGIYTVTVTDLNGCKNFTTTNVTVNPTPTLTATGSTACVGQNMNVGANSIAGSTYVWSGPNAFTAIGQNTVVANAQITMSGIYNVTVTSAVGCTNTATVNVVIIALPTPTIVSNTPCAGATLTLNVTGATGASFSWNGPNGFTSPIQNPSINLVTIPANGVYTVTATAGNCSATTTKSVTINPLPTPLATNNAPICETKNLILTGSGGLGFSWTGPANFVSSIANPTITGAVNAQSGLYILTVTDVNGCQATTSTSVTILQNPAALANGATVCFGQPANLSATGGVSYAWTGPNGYTSSLSNPIIPNVNNTTIGNYMVTVTGVNTCTSITIANVAANPLPVPTITSTPKTCLNTQVSLQGSLGFLMYQWTGPNNFLSPNSSTSFTATNFNQAGTYILSVTDNNGCTGSTSTVVVLNPFPVATLASDNNKNCVPFCSNFTLKPAVGSSSIMSSTWSINGQNFSGSTLNYCITQAGKYSIKANFVDENGCPNSTTYTVTAYPLPSANFEFSPLNPTESIDEVIFTDVSKGDSINNWSWYFINNSGQPNFNQNASYMFPEAGTYPIALVVKNKWGCIDTVVKPITVGENFSFYVPNAFTPNGDGINDTFFPKGHGIVKFDVAIFDRWGEKLFNTSDFFQGWDGTFKGEDCKNDVYVWKINVTMPNSKVKTYTGHVTLNR